jgi:hypothetical protein
MSGAATSGRAGLVANVRLQALGCGHLGSPFYRELLTLMADDVEADGPVWSVLASHAAAPFEAVYPLRLLGGVHRLVLAGREPQLAAHYPSTGGDGDAAAAWPRFRAVVAAAPAVVLDALTRPPQTNEVGRSAPLVGGFLTVARDTGLPLRVLELGASAGLNLRFDHFGFEQDGTGYGDSESPVRFVDFWKGGRPPFDASCTVVERRGCDRDPIDAGSADGRLTLLSYVWPGQEERFELLRAALDVAGRVPVDVDRAEIADWLAEQLEVPQPGRATVVFHSIVWQYLDAEIRAAVRKTLDDAGARATSETPLAWLRLEPGPPNFFPPELRLTRWPGGDERLLATAEFHVGPVRWLA